MKIRPSRSLTLALLAVLAGCSPAGGEQSGQLRFSPADDADPLVLRLSFDYGGKHFSVRVKELAVEAETAARPVAIVVPGCGHAFVAADIPANFVAVDVDENPETLDRSSLAESCALGDTAAISRAVQARVEFALSHLDRVALAAPGQVVLLASGEAAPVVAAMPVAVRGKFLLGDPCLVDWPNTTGPAQAAMVHLRGTFVAGRAWAPAKSALGVGQGDASARSGLSGTSVRCVAKPRPPQSAALRVVEMPGEVTMLERPDGLEALTHAAMLDAIHEPPRVAER